MIALIGFLTIIVLSITVVRIGAVALELTGLSPDVASFQAQSAFSGVGFTTSESESIVSHPVRRRIARILILLGSAGITTSIATFILTFMGPTGGDLAMRAGGLLGGLLVIFIVSRSKLINQLIKNVITKALSRSKSLVIYDYQELLGVSRGYSITRMAVKAGSWLVGRPLKELRLHKEGILILSVHRKIGDQERFIVPSGETEIQPGDALTIYGRDEGAKCLYERMRGEAGDEDHRRCCEIESKRAQIREKTGGVAE